jgi:predicted esterase
MIPPAQAERLAAILTDAGADVELAWQAAGHGLVQGDVTVAQRWFSARRGA